MQILVQPMYSRQELNGDSNYVHYAALIREAARVRPDWGFVVIFPDAKSGFKYEDDGLFSLPNVARVPQRISPRKMASAVTYDGSWYDQLFRQLGFDVVWCNLVEVAGHLGVAGTGSYTKDSAPAVVAAHHYVIHPSLPYPIEKQRNVLLDQLTGALLADANVFNSEHCRKMLFDNAEKYLSAGSVEALKATSRVLPMGTLEGELDYVPKARGPKVPVVIYNHRLQSYKNYRTTFELFDELYREGLKFRVVYTGASIDNVSEIRAYPFVEVRPCATRAEYLQVLRTGDLNVINSQHETFCISAVESMACGQPLVAPNGVTFPEITGRETTKWPFLFSSRAEQKEMVRTLLTDAEQRIRWGKVASDFVRGAFNTKLWFERYAALFESVTNLTTTIAAEDAADLFISTVKKNSGRSTREIFNAMTSAQVGGRTPFGPQAMSATRLIKAARKFGAKVRVVNGVQRVYT